jgi:hypothetical protein
MQTCNAKNTHDQTRSALLLRRNHQCFVLSVKHNVLSPKHNISVDLEVRTAVALHATEAGVSIDLSKGDCVAGDHGGVCLAHCDAEVWELGVAGIGESTDLSIVGCALDFGVVRVGHLRVNKE